MKRAFLLLLAVLASLQATLAGPVARAGSPLTITRSEATFTFQKEVLFTLEASGDSPIARATLSFRLNDYPSLNTVEKDVAPAQTVQVEHSWNLVTADLPSGVLITYWWTVEDQTGARAESARRSLTYLDTRFQWKQISHDDVTLYWYRGDESLGRDLLNTANIAYQRLAGEFGVERQQAQIFIYGDYSELQSGIGASAREWTGGRAYAEYSIVLLGVPPGQGEYGRRAVAHEFAHLIVHRATDNPYGGMPQWLDEGLAMWAEGSLDTESAQALQQAARRGRLLSLRSLSSNFPANGNQANLAYAQSYSVVEYILQTYGSPKMSELLQTFKQGAAYDAALKQALGLTTEELDAAWRASVGASSSGQGGAGAYLSARDGLWFLLQLLLAGAALIAGALLVVLGLLLRAGKKA